jgi:hypothetical protein
MPFSSPENPSTWTIANEFAQVRLAVDREGNDPRLAIHDLASDRVVWLDAFQLAALTRFTPAQFEAFMNPDLPATPTSS